MPLSAEMILHLSQSPTTLVTLWVLTAKDGTTIRVCNHYEDITYDGELYEAIPLEPAKTRSTAGTTSDIGSIDAPLIDPLSAEKLLRGKWGGARVEQFAINYEDHTMGKVWRKVGYLSRPTFGDILAQLELRSLSELLGQTIGDETSELCRAKRYGDAECRGKLGPYTHTGTVTVVIDNQRFTVSISQADDYFRKGTILFTSGENEGIEEEVSSNDGQDIILFEPMIADVQVEDAVTMVRGCDRRFQTCVTFLNPDNPSGTNIENFVGEPFIKGSEFLFKYPE